MRPPSTGRTLFRANALLVLVTVLAGALSWMGAGAVAIGFPALVPVSSARATPTSTCVDGAMVVVAHEDDDLLFTSPDLATDLDSGRCVRTVFLTTGDAAQDTVYWQGREVGSQAAYAAMAGVPDEWTASSITLLGKELRTMTLVGEPQVSLVFLRLPDGNRTGSGMAVHDHESLMKLWLGSIPAIHGVDRSSSYTAETLTQTLTALMTEFGPTTVRTMDWTRPFRTGDNADHTATALFARAAARAAAATLSIDLLAYEGYPAWTRPPNVSGAALRLKAAALTAYAPHDRMFCVSPWCPIAAVTSTRAARQYVVDEERLAPVDPAPAP